MAAAGRRWWRSPKLASEQSTRRSYLKSPRGRAKGIGRGLCQMWTHLSRLPTNEASDCQESGRRFRDSMMQRSPEAPEAPEEDELRERELRCAWMHLLQEVLRRSAVAAGSWLAWRSGRREARRSRTRAQRTDAMTEARCLAPNRIGRSVRSSAIAEVSLGRSFSKR